VIVDFSKWIPFRRCLEQGHEQAVAGSRPEIARVSPSTKASSIASGSMVIMVCKQCSV